MRYYYFQRYIKILFIILLFEGEAKSYNNINIYKISHWSGCYIISHENCFIYVINLLKKSFYNINHGLLIIFTI